MPTTAVLDASGGRGDVAVQLVCLGDEVHCNPRRLAGGVVGTEAGAWWGQGWRYLRAAGSATYAVPFTGHDSMDDRSDQAQRVPMQLCISA